MTVLCSPTDRELLSILKPKIHVLSSLIPERYGADILNIDGNGNGKLCIQRKTMPVDFLASVKDGRLVREIPLLSATEYPVLILEGRPEWTLDGHLMSNYSSRWTRKQLRNMVRTISMIKGIHVEYTDDLTDTAEAVIELVSWHGKDKHISLNSRTKRTKDCWGVNNDKGVCTFILQGFPGIGSAMAGSLLSHFDGLPFRWACEKEELREVLHRMGDKGFEELWNICKSKT